MIVGDCPFQLIECLLSQKVFEINSFMLIVIVVDVVLATLVTNQLSVMALTVNAEVFESVFITLRTEIQLEVEELVDELTVQAWNISWHDG